MIARVAEEIASCRVLEGGDEAGRDGTGLSSIFLKAARFFFRTFRRGCNRGLGLRGVED
jgi:hypothetical protein